MISHKYSTPTTSQRTSSHTSFSKTHISLLALSALGKCNISLRGTNSQIVNNTYVQLTYFKDKLMIVLITMQIKISSHILLNLIFKISIFFENKCCTYKYDGELLCYNCYSDFNFQIK